MPMGWVLRTAVGTALGMLSAAVGDVAAQSLECQPPAATPTDPAEAVADGRPCGCWDPYRTLRYAVAPGAIHGLLGTSALSVLRLSSDPAVGEPFAEFVKKSIVGSLECALVIVPLDYLANGLLARRGGSEIRAKLLDDLPDGMMLTLAWSPATVLPHLMVPPGLRVAANHALGALYFAALSFSINRAPASAPPPRAVPLMTIVRTVARYMWPVGEPGLRLRVVASAVLLVLAKVSALSLPFWIKFLVNSLARGGGMSKALGLSSVAIVIIYGATRVLAAALLELRNSIFVEVANFASRSVATQVYTHLYSLGLEFHVNRKTGALTGVVERGTKGVGTVMVTAYQTIAPTFLELGLVCTALGVAVGGQFAATAASTAVLYILYTAKVTTWRIPLRHRMNAAEKRAAQHALEGLLSYEAVKHFGAAEHEVGKYNDALGEYCDAAGTIQKTLSAMFFGQNVILSASVTAMMYLSTSGVLAGTLTVGDVVMVNTLLYQFAIPLNALAYAYREMSMALDDVEVMLAILELDPSPVDRAGAVDYEYRGGRIEFQDVSFRYAPDKPLLQSLSFTVDPGTTVAFVGPSGGGKSTILRLLFRFYDPSSGRILVDGQDVQSLRIASLRRHMGVVAQDTMLFNDTLRYNIKYGTFDAAEAAVEEAVRLAALEDTVAHMPLKLDTLVGERGVKLSGGEKQRVTLARVFLKDPRILLCDEATSALDSGTEAVVMAALANIRRRDTTTLVIAHRLSTVQAADAIVVLHKGRTVEKGTHDELVALGGIYYALWSTQRRQQDSPPPASPTDRGPSPSPPVAAMTPRSLT